MLKPEQEISAAYLRTVRQTLREVILQEVSSAAGRNALALCDLTARVLALGLSLLGMEAPDQM